MRRELPDDNEVAESLFHAQVALKKSRGEEVHNMKFGGEVEEILGLEQFRAAICLPGRPSHLTFCDQLMYTRAASCKCLKTSYFQVSPSFISKQHLICNASKYHLLWTRSVADTHP